MTARYSRTRSPAPAQNPGAQHTASPQHSASAGGGTRRTTPPPGALAGWPPGPRSCQRTGAPRRAAPRIGTRARAPLGAGAPTPPASPTLATGRSVHSPRARARRRRGGRQRGTRRAMARMRVPRESSLARSDLAHGSRAGAPRTRRAARARTARRARTFRTTRSEPRPLRLRAPAKLYAVSSARSRSFLLSHLPGRQNS